MLKETEHLTEQEVAICAEALVNGTYNKLPKHLSQHIEQCELCANEISMVAELAQDFELDTTSKVKPKRVWLYISTSAAASVAIVMLGYYILQNQQTNTLQNNPTAINHNTLKTIDTVSTSIDSNRTSPHKTDSVVLQTKNITATSTKVILAQYQPNKQLEQLCNNFADAAYRGDDIEVITPIDFSISGNDSLKWENPLQAALTVEIFNNKGERITTIETKGNSIAIPSISNGLYYWKLINEEYDLIFCGRITFRK